MAMQVLPHGLPLVQCGPWAPAEPPLRQVLIKFLRASPVMPFACALHSVILCCCGLTWALADIAKGTVIATAIRYFLISFHPSEFERKNLPLLWSYHPTAFLPRSRLGARNHEVDLPTAALAAN